MKSLTSTLFLKGQPLPKGLDVALLFALENFSAINLHYSRLEKNLAEAKREEEELEQSHYWLGPLILGLAGIILAVVLKYYFGIITAGSLVWFIVLFFSHKKKLEDAKEKQEQLMKELNGKMPQMVKKIGTVNYCAEILPLGSETIVVDSSDIIAETRISCMLTDNMEERLKKVMDLMAGLSRDFPVLLPPGEIDLLSDDLYLTGIEKDAEDTLLALDQLILNAHIVSLDLPVFKKNDAIPEIMRDYENRFDKSSNHLTSIKTLRDRSSVMEKLSRTKKEVELVKNCGFSDPASLARSVYFELNDLTINLTENRNYSLNDVLIKSIESIEKIYDFPLTRFYNPNLSGSATMENPVRNYEGIDFEGIDTSEFEPFYKKNDMLKLRDLQIKVKSFLQNLPESERSANAELLTYLQKRFDKYAELIKEMSLEIAPDVEEQNNKHYKNAILKYNIFKNKWICQLTNEEFTEGEALKSRILKIKEDLINPVWDKLWLEKHDEKVKIIREKELELRENKKQENSEMREEVKIFTEELRPIRNNLEKSAIEARIGEQKLKLSMNFYTSQGILSKDVIDRMKSYLSTEEVNVEAVFQSADNYEASLEREPECIMLVRGELKDYALQMRNKEKFYLNHK